MPEGPEIRRAADKLADTLVDQVVDEVWFGLPRLEPFAERLSGRRVVSLGPRGKALLIEFDNDLTLYSHNLLYGRWYVRARNSYPKTNRSLRVALHTERSSALLYSASDIAVLDRDELDSHPFLSRIGPDLLDSSLSRRDLVERIRDERFLNRSLGSLYLDQAFIAGVGNYLRSEILHFARAHPRQKPSDLTAAEQRKLAAATLDVGRRAYEQKGVTNPPRLVSRLKKQGMKRRQYRHAVFGRDGQPCHRCKTTIERTEATSRRLYFCPACQGL